MEEQQKETFKTKIKAFLRECRRVLRVTKKPDSDEFKTTVKVTAIGMIVIGLIGFIIQMINYILF